MSKKTCGCVGVQPRHLQVIIGLGSRRVEVENSEVYGTTAEDLVDVLDLSIGTVLEALDDLMGCRVVKDHEDDNNGVELFYLDQLGIELFHGILEAIKESA